MNSAGSPPFGVLIPGFEVQTNFEVIGDKGVLTIQNPKTINVIGFFLNVPLADNAFGAALYFSWFPYDSLQFIGAIANTRPSDIFHTGWSLNPLVNILPELKLVVQLEPLVSLETQIKISQDTDLNKQFAIKVAQNLFNYVQSFNRNDQTEKDGLLVVPLNTLDKWIEKFMRKYSFDPNFVFKTDA